ncbi:hypothetical protein H632_c4446p0, partial [Helicosporidium sp. ATCC 50920]
HGQLRAGDRIQPRHHGLGHGRGARGRGDAFDGGTGLLVHRVRHERRRRRRDLQRAALHGRGRGTFGALRRVRGRAQPGRALRHARRAPLLRIGARHRIHLDRHSPGRQASVGHLYDARPGHARGPGPLHHLHRHGHGQERFGHRRRLPRRRGGHSADRVGPDAHFSSAGFFCLWRAHRAHAAPRERCQPLAARVCAGARQPRGARLLLRRQRRRRDHR